jgi:hypothetical protein
MWQFAAGLYLVFLADGSLRLAAIFGFAGGSLMLLLGGIIGDWVDRNGRMKGNYIPHIHNSLTYLETDHNFLHINKSKH